MNSWYPPPSTPRAVTGGIKARSARGAIAKTWWSKRFISSLEEIGVGGRIARGKSYARRGQVISLDIAPGMVTASVQGSRSRPYRVRIGLPAFDKRAWAGILDGLAENAWFAAKLLAGEMPPDIEEVFEAQGLSLFPASLREVTMDCSCPDWEVPCKHLAATFYLLAEDFDADPFLILAWRGREREDLLEVLSGMRTGTTGADRGESATAVVPLHELMDSYWTAGPPPPWPHIAPVAVAELVSQVPDVDVSVRGVRLRDAIVPVYRALADDL